MVTNEESPSTRHRPDLGDEPLAARDPATAAAPRVSEATSSMHASAPPHQVPRTLNPAAIAACVPGQLVPASQWTHGDR